MPRAEAYMVREDGKYRLEDRFDQLDLWTSQTVIGRWEDDDGRFFTLAKFDTIAPKFTETTLTREDWEKTRVRPGRRKNELRDECVAKLTPFEMPEEPARPRQAVRGLDDVCYFEGTNTTAIVCAFRPEKSDLWYYAQWNLLAGDDYDYSRELFEKDFLGKWDEYVGELKIDTSLDDEKAARAAEKKRAKLPPIGERELLRRDARHSVAAYREWRTTDSDEFTVLDDLDKVSGFIVTLTNELKTMRAKYAAAFPSPIDGSNVLSVARIYRDRDEYLDALEAGGNGDMTWSAAYWSPRRRELVAYLPEDGTKKLMETIRHEAFHQYISYAASMLTVSPWLNEGYAEYFENTDSLDWNLQGVTLDLEKFSETIPAILRMDYQEFYDGSDLMRQVKYRMAWSMAVFLEKGAPKVRFEPFKDLKRDYIDVLIKTKDPVKATSAAFKSEDNLKLFQKEWLKFWRP